MQVDMTAYKLFKHLKEKYPSKMVYITQDDLISLPAQLAGSHRAYVEKRFAEVGLRILHHNHKYDTLTTSAPQLGLVYMAGDSVINPGFEVWALVGHNAQAIDGMTV